MVRAVPPMLESRDGLLLALGLGIAPRAVTQTRGRCVRIAFRGGASPDAGAQQNMVDPLVQGLRTLGYVDSENATLGWRWAEGRLKRLPTLLPVADEVLQ
jgi:hypothetical protein